MDLSKLASLATSFFVPVLDVRHPLMAADRAVAGVGLLLDCTQGLRGHGRKHGPPSCAGATPDGHASLVPDGRARWG